MFCSIRDGSERVSLVHEDHELIAFMDIRPVRRGQVVVIPKQHLDHFTDLPDDLATAVFLTGQRLARVLRRLLEPRRVGLIVHGFGVPHAHLIVVPLEHPWDITAAQFAEIHDGRLSFRWEAVPLAPRADLDHLAASISNGLSAAAAGS